MCVLGVRLAVVPCHGVLQQDTGYSCDDREGSRQILKLLPACPLCPQGSPSALPQGSLTVLTAPQPPVKGQQTQASRGSGALCRLDHATQAKGRP